MPAAESGPLRIISSKWILLAGRTIQLWSIAFAALACGLLDMTPAVRVSFFIFASVMIVKIGHPFARIEGDNSGLFVQRYFKVHFVEWARVRGARTSFGEGGIRIEFCQIVAGSRYAIVNVPNMPVKEAIATAAGRKKLEIVTWIEDHIRTAKETSAPESVLDLQ